MKNVVIMAIIGVGATVILSGCGQTPKEETYNLIYETGISDVGLSEERAKCVADKTIEELSEDDLVTLVKIRVLKEAGKEGEIKASRKYMATTYALLQKIQGATIECSE